MLQDVRLRIGRGPRLRHDAGASALVKQCNTMEDEVWIAYLAGTLRGELQHQYRQHRCEARQTLIRRRPLRSGVTDPLRRRDRPKRSPSNHSAACEPLYTPKLKTPRGWGRATSIPKKRSCYLGLSPRHRDENAASGPARKDDAASRSNPAHGFCLYFRPQSTLAAARMRYDKLYRVPRFHSLAHKRPDVPLYPVAILAGRRCHPHKSMERRPASTRHILCPMVRLGR